MSGKNQKSAQKTARTQMGSDLVRFLEENQLQIFADRLESEGIFSLRDIQLLSREDITAIQSEVDKIGYRNRLGDAYERITGNTDQKDEESEPIPQRPTKPALKKPTRQQQQQRPSKRGPSTSRRPPVKRSDAEMFDYDSPGFLIYLLVFMLTLVLVAAAILLPNELKTVAKQVGLAKKYPGRKLYNNMDSFFKFYLKEHTDPTAQLLHVVGTAISVLVMLFNPSLILSVISTICTGLVAKPFCNGFSSGIVEGLIAVSVGQLTALSLNNWRKLMFMMVLGYGLAWVGHFRFEKNTPATFQAPTYSLMSDFLLFGNYVRQAFLTKKFPLEKGLTAAMCQIKPESFAPVLKSIRNLIPK